MNPVKKRRSYERISPTASSIGKVEPSLRSLTTTADADDPLLAGLQVALQVSVVCLAVGRGHHHLHVLADNIGCGIAEQAFRGGAEGLDRSLLVDDDHGIRNGGEDRFQM